MPEVWHTDVGASIKTPNIRNSTLIIEELGWGGQDTLNTCENSFFWTSFGPWKAKKRGRTWTNPRCGAAILILERFTAGSSGGFVL